MSNVVFCGDLLFFFVERVEVGYYCLLICSLILGRERQSFLHGLLDYLQFKTILMQKEAHLGNIF